MSIRSFWTILVKTLGIYVLLESLITIPQFLATFYFFISHSDTLGDNTAMLKEGLYVICLVLFYIQLLRYCIFKTDLIIDKLKLDQGFEDERFEFNIHRSTILKISIIIIGGLLLISNTPLFCKEILSYSQQISNYSHFTDSPQAKYIVIYLIEIFIGYFMLTCSRMIVNFIELKRKKASRPEEI
jgi:hypothetical protein